MSRLSYTDIETKRPRLQNGNFTSWDRRQRESWVSWTRHIQFELVYEWSRASQISSANSKVWDRGTETNQCEFGYAWSRCMYLSFLAFLFSFLGFRQNQTILQRKKLVRSSQLAWKFLKHQMGWRHLQEYHHVSASFDWNICLSSVRLTIQTTASAKRTGPRLLLAWLQLVESQNEKPRLVQANMKKR